MRTAFGLLTTVILVCLLGGAVRGQLTVYIAGDSTAANKTDDKRPETGWGEKLQQHFDPARVGLAIADHFDGEYKRVSDQLLNTGIGAEDPFIWIENRKYKA